ncbi:MAG: PQ-loop domain-containing transporter [bacterium]|nr:PQ-loop domain-containing transporter [bacterium]
MKGLHHLHLRKRISRGLEPFPARTLWKRSLDKVVLGVGIIGPLASIPQVLKIYLVQDATGLSGISWGIWALLDIPWIIYGLVHRERPIIVAYSLWFTVNSLVFIGAMMYGGGLL